MTKKKLRDNLPLIKVLVATLKNKKSSEEYKYLINCLCDKSLDFISECVRNGIEPKFVNSLPEKKRKKYLKTISPHKKDIKKVIKKNLNSKRKKKNNSKRRWLVPTHSFIDYSSYFRFDFPKMISYYAAPYSQRGHGFGGFFRGLAKFITPIAQTVKKVAANPTVRSIAKEAISTGVGLAADALEGKKNMKEQAKKALNNARQTVSNTMRNAAGIKRDYEEIDEDEYDSEDDTPAPPKKRKVISSKIAKKHIKRKTIFDD